MTMRMPPFPADLDWSVYGFDSTMAGEPFVQGYGYDGSRPLYGKWRMANVTIHYGDIHNWNIPWHRVISAPRFGETALQELHSGLGLAGFVFGMSGTGHISGAPVPPEPLTVVLDGRPVQADAWRGESAEVAWIETSDTWITIRSSKAALAGTRLTEITDLGPLLEARQRKLGLPGM